MHLYPQDSTSPLNLPVGRQPLVFVLAVPNHMTYADFCQFCGSFIQQMLEMRIVWNDGMEDQDCALIRFEDQISADSFFKHFNGKMFSSLEVCRYCQQQPEKSTCSICGTSENLWICVICGFVGCGRYKEGHAFRHWKDTQHCYSLELETQRIWDYVGDNYDHRLIQSKTDGKLVELNFHCIHAEDTCGTCEISQTLFSSKVDAIVGEYNDLLTSQLENQRKYFELLLLEAKEESDKEIEKAVTFKLQKLHSKLAKCVEEKRFLDDVNENLIKNQEMWKVKVQQIEEREKAAVKLRDERIQRLEEQLQDLIVHIEAQKVVDETANSDIKGGTVSAGPSPSWSTSKSTKHATKNRRS